MVHHRVQIGRSVQAAIVPLIDRLQARQPTRLLPTVLVVTELSEMLSVSGGVVRKYLTDAVADGQVMEILVRRDWMLVPPFVGQPTLVYAEAAKGEGVFRMTRERPASRGSNGLSFLTSVGGYDILLDAMVNLDS